MLATLLRIVGDSPDYFVSGSLSFLPLLPPYREPAHDVDVGIGVDLFRQREGELAGAGRLHVLRLSEVAIADASPLTRLLAPRTRFVHVDTPDGLIDLAQYRQRGEAVDLFLGAGLTLRFPSAALSRVHELEWQGLRFRAAPVEMAILPKLLWYQALKSSGETPSPESAKHLEDLQNTTGLVDWDFSEFLVGSIRVLWRDRPMPSILDRALNPLRKLDLARMRDELHEMSEATARRGRGDPPTDGQSGG